MLENDGIQMKIVEALVDNTLRRLVNSFFAQSVTVAFTAAAVVATAAATAVVSAIVGMDVEVEVGRRGGGGGSSDDR